MDIILRIFLGIILIIFFIKFKTFRMFFKEWIKLILPIFIVFFLTIDDRSFSNDIVNIILLVIFGVLTIRFILRLIYNNQFNSNRDLFISIVESFIFFCRLSQNKEFINMIVYILNVKTTSYVLQLFVIHICLLLFIFTLISGIISYLGFILVEVVRTEKDTIVFIKKNTYHY